MKFSGENFKRADRVGEAIKAEIANILSRKIKDPRVGFVTVTSVQVSDDLRTAKVYIAPSIQNSGEVELNNLSRTSGFIRRELGRALQLRYIPELIFKLESDSPLKVLELLEQIKGPDEETVRKEND
ncbi:MAG: 30S ribosome-binding factor RbfA [Nitrospiria bacterium]